jgi:copper chaperone
MNTVAKKIGLFCLACFSMLLLHVDANAQSVFNQKEQKMENIQEKAITLQLSVKGMSCQAGCANGIDNMLSKQEGILDSKTLVSTSSSEIRYDKDKVSEKYIIDLIAQRGFEVEVKNKDE